MNKESHGGVRARMGKCFGESGKWQGNGKYVLLIPLQLQCATVLFVILRRRTILYCERAKEVVKLRVGGELLTTKGRRSCFNEELALGKRKVHVIYRCPLRTSRCCDWCSEEWKSYLSSLISGYIQYIVSCLLPSFLPSLYRKTQSRSRPAISILDNIPLHLQHISTYGDTGDEATT
jgi:hypothetical protein